MSTATPDPSRIPASRGAALEALDAAGRLAAYHDGSLDGRDLATWAALWPEEVPIVNDEFEWIAATLE